MDSLSHTFFYSFLGSYAWSFFFWVRLSKLAAKPIIDSICGNHRRRNARGLITFARCKQAWMHAHMRRMTNRRRSKKTPHQSNERARAAASLARRWLKNRSRRDGRTVRDGEAGRREKCVVPAGSPDDECDAVNSPCMSGPRPAWSVSRAGLGGQWCPLVLCSDRFLDGRLMYSRQRHHHHHQSTFSISSCSNNTNYI